MSGLIVERGNDAFGFLHLTFQEYFAGRALAQMKAEDRWRADIAPLTRPALARAHFAMRRTTRNCGKKTRQM